MKSLLVFSIIFLACFTTLSIAGHLCKRRLKQQADLFQEKLDKCLKQLAGKQQVGTGASCKEIHDKSSAQENKAYQLQVDSVRTQKVYCHMANSGLGACGGGGWTLVMKTDGSKQTFHYDSAYWTNKDEYKPENGDTGLDNQETKLFTYFKTPFTKICVGMKLLGQAETKFLPIVYQASSLYSVIGDGKYRPLSLGLDTWRSLIGTRSSMQLNCRKEGFNAQTGGYGRARIGIIGNDQDDCGTCDSRIGFGTGGANISGADNSNTCGNDAIFNADNGERHIRAMGYIFIQ